MGLAVREEVVDNHADDRELWRTCKLTLAQDKASTLTRKTTRDQMTLPETGRLDLKISTVKHALAVAQRD